VLVCSNVFHCFNLKKFGSGTLVYKYPPGANVIKLFAVIYKFS
jgi:hypothetical protein